MRVAVVGCRGSDALVSPRERALAGRLDAINAEFCERVRPLPPPPPPFLGQKTRLVFLLHMPALLELASVKVCKLILGCGCVQLESLQSKTDEKVDAILELLKQKKVA